jgi:hypothetical protein
MAPKRLSTEETAMRKLIFVAALGLAACTTSAGRVTTTTLTAADAATSLAVGEQIFVERGQARQASEGMDPVVPLTLRHADGRTLNFQQGNHTPHDLAAQRPDGPLAQLMGLMGGETPVLYNATRTGNRGAPFICGPEGPAAIGYYEADGAAMIVGLKQAISFETLPSGELNPIPYSPDQVCARLRFR